MNNDFCYLTDENTSILFHIPSSAFYRIFSPHYKESLYNFFVNKKDDSTAIELLENAHKTLEEEKFTPVVKNNFLSVPVYSDFVINRLVISVTNICNFKCSYCYAKGGDYGLPHTKMDYTTADKVINYFFRNFKRINAVQFFGGEPSINTSLIRYICDSIRKLNESGVINYMPRFGFITNGYSLPNELIDTICEYKFGITFSIDGPAEIHNILRQTKTGEKTFSTIKQNYDKLKERIKSYSGKIGIEATYTAEHIRQNISILDVLKFCESLGVTLPHITPVTVPDDHFLSLSNFATQYESYIKELIDYTFSKILEGKLITNDLILRTIQTLFDRPANARICDAGYGTIAVSSDGHISSCFIFTSSENLQICTIDDNPQIVLNKAKQFYTNETLKNTYQKCQNCWARNICSSCLGAFYNDDTQKLGEPLESSCLTIKSMLKYTLLKFGEIKADQDKWDSFLKLCKTKDIPGC